MGILWLRSIPRGRNPAAAGLVEAPTSVYENWLHQVLGTSHFGNVCNRQGDDSALRQQFHSTKHSSAGSVAAPMEVAGNQDIQQCHHQSRTGTHRPLHFRLGTARASAAAAQQTGMSKRRLRVQRAVEGAQRELLPLRLVPEPSPAHRVTPRRRWWRSLLGSFAVRSWSRAPRAPR